MLRSPLHHLALSGILAVTCVLVHATPAAAQADSEATQVLTSTSTTTTSTAVVIGGIILTVVLITPSKKRSAWMLDYLRQHPAAVRQGLALGAGAAVDDLARALRLKPERRVDFGRLLRRERATLLALADPARLDEARAESFAVHLIAALRRDGLVLSP